ncbi:PIN domain-containing protein [Microbacterium sp. NPDC089695]|uniref:PIN domain-containing protein n=1 Tax=Microbacterium sp. NPDC089695 TaxID=3364198 RepID=UPI0037F81827
MYKAVLDTCALVPSLQRDFLLQLAAERAYAPVWGSGILFELDYVLERLDKKRGIDGEESDRYRKHLFDQMGKAFPGSTVNAPKDREYAYDLDDPDDGHVAHAAIIGKADAIVTDDRRAGFPTSHTLQDANVETVSPVEFAANTVAAPPPPPPDRHEGAPGDCVTARRDTRSDPRRPPRPLQHDRRRRDPPPIALSHVHGLQFEQSSTRIRDTK